MACDSGQDAAHSGKYPEAVELLARCLSDNNLSVDSRTRALQARAWAHANLKQHQLAVSDQEAAFALKAPSDYREFINYASYLRSVKRYEDSLRALRSAEAFEASSGTPSMMTHYNLGWTLHELGRYEEAAQAFSKGIPAQPDYPFVYWRRGLAFDAMGRKEDARKDFETFAMRFASFENKASVSDWLPAIREKLQQYGIPER